ncbi:MAG: nitroreductase family deazaflavin-dependent oxidoreductase [Actinomycetota bacterium]|nr:nitroreductase family deazaflavin-dependent oxidoreductase [Actinomycetota bacterium]
MLALVLAATALMCLRKPQTRGEPAVPGTRRRGPREGEAVMPERPRRPIGRQLQARFMRAVNVPMRVILGLPFATPLSGRLMLAWITGRKTGKVYRQPVSYVRQGSTLLTPGGGNWKLNLQDGHPVRIRLHGHDALARPELVADVDEVERLLAVMTDVNPGVRAFVGIPRGPDGRLDRNRLEVAVQHGFRVVRWHLDERPP